VFVRPIAVILLAAAAACSGSSSEGSPAPAPTPAPAAASTRPTPAPAPTGQDDPRLARGAALHQKYCALCHGPEGRGYAADNAPSLVTSTFLASADDSFFTRSIELGRPGTAMAGYGTDVGGPLGDRDIADLVHWYRSHGPGLRPLPPVAGGDAARGAQLYAAACQTCHGDQANRGTAPHLANPTFLALASPEYIRYAIASGRPGTPMEAFAGKLTDAQIDDLVAFVRSWAKPPPAPPTPPPTSAAAAPKGEAVVLNPKGKPPTFTLRDDRFVPAAEVAKALKDKRRMIIIDARAPSDWLRERIPGALSIPYYEPAGLSRIPPDDGTWVLAYCACPHHASGVIVDELRKRGYKHTAVIDEGILFWKKQGYPVEGDPSAAPDPHAGHDHSGHGH
jgi:mono/diheme cytochrome c family protein/rhodanese-related sulfurtransferase